ncbi:MAG: hypothetical protein QOE28_1950 [Solirubrobacteraceae bacterium]|nr:hypothetical protein [Solirubrobacteraceae bacterium]
MAKERTGTVKGRIELVDLGDRTRPAIAASIGAADGQRRPVKLGDDGSLALDGKLVGEGLTLELSARGGEAARSYRYDLVYEQLGKDEVLRIPPGAWNQWILPFTCVTGRVRVCRFPFPWHDSVGDIIKTLGLTAGLAEIQSAQSFPRPHLSICRPVCQGKVEVFLQTCCCPQITVVDPPVVIKNLCEIIDCREIVWPQFPHDPGDPVIVRGPHGPGGGGDPAPMAPMPEEELPDVGGPLGALHSGVERALVRAIKRAEASEDGPAPAEVLRAAAHLSALVPLSADDRVRYVQRYPELHWAFCRCSTSKVGEAVLHGDGHFDACFLRPFVRKGCSVRVQYRVSQFQGGAWVVIYDDLATHRSHALAEDAVLDASWLARGCDDDPHDWGDRPFALLERIGTGTHANLMIHSTNQASEDSWNGPFAATDGLVNPRPASVPVSNITAGPYDQPWGATLALRYALAPGLPGIGARYYRTRVLQLNAAGNPIAGTEHVANSPITWGRYVYVGGDVHIEWVPLAHAPVNGIDHLYTIPDHASDWLDEQYHAEIDTTQLAGARHIFILELYDAAGNRLVPDSGPAAGAGDHAAAFDYRRLTGPLDVPFTNTAVVHHRALGNLFLVDNVHSFADIEMIRRNAETPSGANCQFLTGHATDTISLKYSAYQADGYQWFHEIRLKQGLTGPDTQLELSNADVSHGFSPSETFHDLLSPETKCSFAASLAVRVRHTNGSGLLTNYDSYDWAAFALEVVP